MGVSVSSSHPTPHLSSSPPGSPLNEPSPLNQSSVLRTLPPSPALHNSPAVILKFRHSLPVPLFTHLSGFPLFIDSFWLCHKAIYKDSTLNYSRIFIMSGSSSHEKRSIFFQITLFPLEIVHIAYDIVTYTESNIHHQGLQGFRYLHCKNMLGCSPIKNIFNLLASSLHSSKDTIICTP